MLQFREIMRYNDLIQDSKKALNVLTMQPDIDPNRISIIGHSKGTINAPRVAIDNSTKVKNIVLMGTVAQNMGDIVHYQAVSLPSAYSTQVLDKNHTGLISKQQIAMHFVRLPMRLQISHQYIPYKNHFQNVI
jgi:uncharacterized protein